jgi:predicted Rossmann fold flavoprotein
LGLFLEVAVYDLIIVGGGASGLFLASNLNLNGKKGLIIDSNKELGLKILASGSSQCNLTNGEDIINFFEKYNDKGKSIKYALSKNTNIDLINFIEENGVPLIIREDRKVFPASLKATTIRDLLVKLSKENGFEIMSGKKVIDIQKDQNFRVLTIEEEFNSKYLVLATGGSSYPKLGSDGKMLDVLKKLGHEIIKPKQCLGPIYVKDYPFSGASGISLKEINLFLYRDNKKIKTFNGDLLFTHKNFSGPIILNNSRYFEVNDILKVEFLDRGTIEKALSSNDKRILKNQFNDILPIKIIDILNSLLYGILDKKSFDLKKEERNKLFLLSEVPFFITNLSSWDEAMTTCGGVSFSSINTKTYESKQVSKLYVLGEMLNFDGQTGGYSFQACYSIAKICAKELTEQLSIV